VFLNHFNKNIVMNSFEINVLLGCAGEQEIVVVLNTVYVNRHHFKFGESCTR
jgi:hypothetical protein